VNYFGKEIMMDKDNFEIYKSTMRKMIRIGRLHRTVFERNISKMGIHHSQHHLLMYIAKEKEIPSQKQIAEKFGITSAAVARSLKSLEAEGYIQRSNVEDDNRFKRIIITDKGREIIEKSHQLFEEIDNSMYEDFSEEDILKFNEYLDKMQSKLIEKNEENCCVRR
ncbi:MAG: MarR family transcriptional regulator, partial [Clostridia bacterium]|nr:MarR family transcriptional regulator [Clostridia bacterium]